MWAKGISLNQDAARVNSPNSSSKEVMARVFDSQFQVVTSSKKNQKKEVIDQITQNLSNLKLNNQSLNMEQEEKIYPMQIAQENVDLSLLDNSYKIFLSKVAQDTSFTHASNSEKVQILIEYLYTDNQDISMGTLIFIFEIIYNYREALNNTDISLILLELFKRIPEYYAQKNFYMVICCLEILGLIGPHNISFNNVKLLIQILMEDSMPLLQQKSFITLMQLDYPGLYALLDLANRDIQDIPLFILQNLVKTEEVLKNVIVPSLLNDVATGSPKKRVAACAALNRTCSLIQKVGGNELLIQLLNEGVIDRQLISCCIRSSGLQGEKALIKTLKTTKNPKIKQAIITLLAWRIPDNSPNKLIINVVNYQVAKHMNLNPGTMGSYKGSLLPLMFQDQMFNQRIQYDNPTNNPTNNNNSQIEEIQVQSINEIQENDILEITSRDLIASLQRYLIIKYNVFKDPSQIRQESYDIKQNGFINEFSIVKLIDPSQFQTKHTNISQDVINCLIQALNDEDAQVRESALNSLGIIGEEEAVAATNQIIQCLNDKDPQVKAMATWTIGKLGQQGAKDAKPILLKMLKNSFWKVRTAACVTIGSIGQSFSDEAFPILTKILREGSINKQIVCETIIRLGRQGEQILIDILRSLMTGNGQLKTAIISSFQLADVSQSSIDFVIEELFRHSKDNLMNVRKSCVITLQILRERSQSANITYLKTRNVLPLFYFFLQDQCEDIRNVALNSITQFGPQAELIFIEGLTKDRNPLIRAECARGLGLLGVQNFRALLFGLRDVDEQVRKATSYTINSQFTSESVINEYKNKVSQLPALLQSLQEVIQQDQLYNQKTSQMFQEIVQSLNMYVDGPTVDFNLGFKYQQDDEVQQHDNQDQLLNGQTDYLQILNDLKNNEPDQFQQLMNQMSQDDPEQFKTLLEQLGLQTEQQEDFQNQQDERQRNEDDINYIQILRDMQENDPEQYNNLMNQMQQDDPDQYNILIQQLEQENFNQLGILKEMRLRDPQQFELIMYQLRNDDEEQYHLIMEHLEKNY